ncbi:MAG TPA: methyltransferase domain-containing protein [Solirubrobacterales bacterium]|nr:methyltransferase domain-containing protein [Solirubrobacterales bacterium]
MADQTSPVAPREDAGAAPEYGSYYYRHDCGIPYERNEHWLGFFDRIAEEIVREFHPGSVLDAGCAMGFLVEGLRKRGVDAKGVDVSEYAISQVHESVAEHCSVASLSEPLPGRYDLVTCIEVLEHIPPEEASTAIANLCAATDCLLLSTSPSDYAEPTHLNVQPPEFWSAALAREGFFREVDRDVSYLTPWAALYVRREEPLPDTVRRYDRSWWRLRKEVQEVREALLKSQEQLAELEAGEVEDRPELLQELDRRQEEILRLRDQLIARDAELGTARGRLCEIEDQNQRVTSVANRVHARLPRVFRLFGAVLRRLRGLTGG